MSVLRAAIKQCIIIVNGCSEPGGVSHEWTTPSIQQLRRPSDHDYVDDHHVGR